MMRSFVYDYGDGDFLPELWYSEQNDKTFQYNLSVFLVPTCRHSGYKYNLDGYTTNKKRGNILITCEHVCLRPSNWTIQNYQNLMDELELDF